MKNFIAKYRDRLSEKNYVRKASYSSNYFFSIYKKELESYREKYEYDFNIIFYGNENSETDYYVIPFIYLNDILTQENLYQAQNRWVGDIKNHIINFRVSKKKLNVSQYYSLPFSSKSTVKNLNRGDSVDYAIQNAKRLISVREKQSVFRSKVLGNFNNKCCISGIIETDLLVASHIIPWSKKIGTRLDPGNGLCLSVLFDKLFDKGYFTLNDEKEVIITNRASELSQQTKNTLNKIKGQKIASPTDYPISCSYLAYHRKHVFESFQF